MTKKKIKDYFKVTRNILFEIVKNCRSHTIKNCRSHICEPNRRDYHTQEMKDLKERDIYYIT